MRVLIADRLEQSAARGIAALGCDVSLKPEMAKPDFHAALAGGDAEVLVVRSRQVPREALEPARGLRLIVRAGAGVDNIDIPAATERGVGVCNCPGVNAVAVAELAIGLMISCDRRVPDQTAALRGRQWDKKGFTTGARGLKGSTLGIVGFGSIGQAVARRAAAFEMNVAAWDIQLTPASARSHGVVYIGTRRPELLSYLPSCDIVSIHLALTPETARFCNDEFFAAMKPGATFINTSRGGVVDEAALCRAAAARQLRLGLDVYENQPSASGVEFVTPVTAISGSAFTHHCGASTDQAQRAVADETVRIIKVFKETGRMEHCVNETVLPEVRTPMPRAASGPTR